MTTFFDNFDSWKTGVSTNQEALLTKLDEIVRHISEVSKELAKVAKYIEELTDTEEENAQGAQEDGEGEEESSQTDQEDNVDDDGRPQNEGQMAEENQIVQNLTNGVQALLPGQSNLGAQNDDGRPQ